MNENEGVKPIVYLFPLLELSPELQLNIFSFLPDKDLDSLSKSCGQFRKIVLRNRKNLYRRTIICGLHCGTVREIYVCPDFHKSFRVLNKIGDPPVFTSVSDVTNIKNADRNWKQILEETFLGLSFKQFFDKISERAAGIRLILENLELPHLEILQHALKHTVRLDITCRVDSLSREMQFRHLFAPRHSLFVSHTALDSEPCIVDSEFCRVAGYGELEIFGTFPWLSLTDDQLMTLVRRNDLKRMRTWDVEGMSFDRIRIAAQVLLETSKECFISFRQESLDFDLAFHHLSRQIGDERIQIRDTTSSDHGLFDRKHKKQYCYTNETRCVKICIGYDDDDDDNGDGDGKHDYEIVLQSNSVDPEKSD